MSRRKSERPVSNFKFQLLSLIPPLLLLLATFLAYANSFHVPFLFDDNLAIVQNATLRDLHDWRQLLSPPTGGATVHGRPVVNLTLALSYALHGLDLRGYHLFNLIIHMLNGLLVFGLARRLLAVRNQGPHASSPPVTNYKLQGSNLLPFAIALLWLLHPLCTQAVTYIVQRAESLAALFYLLTLYALVRASHEPYPARRRQARLWSAVALAACALGMATKETIVTAPLLALLLDRAFLAGRYPALGARTPTDIRFPSTVVAAPRAASAPPPTDNRPVRHSLGEGGQPTTDNPPLSPSPWRALFRERGRLHLALWATLLIQVVIQLQPGTPRGPQTGFGSAVSPLDYLLTQSAVITHYLRLALWPDALCFDYRWPIASSPAAVWPHLLLVSALFLGACGLWIRVPRLGFLALAFFLILAPTSSIMPIVDPAFEHRMYLPLVPLVALAVCGVRRAWCWIQGRICNRSQSPNNQQPTTDNRSLAPRQHADTPIRPHLLAALCAAALLLGARTHLRNLDYQSDFGLWQDTLEKRPANGRAWYNRGYLHQKAGRTVAALEDYKQAIAIAPDMPGPYYNRANLFMEAGRVAEALADYDRGIEREEANPILYYNRGLAKVRLGRIGEAITDFNACILLAPRMPMGFYQRADALAALERYEDAIADYTRAIQLDPSMVDAYHNRAAAYLILGQLEPARADLATCRRLGSEPSPELLQMLEEANR